MSNIATPNFEEKGKIFTEVVSKIAIEVIIQTTTHRIYGKVHIRPGERLKDELDRVELTLAVTDAVVYDQDGILMVFKSKFIALQKSHIIWVLPQDQVEPETQGEK
jgi:hypothetical protein